MPDMIVRAPEIAQEAGCSDIVLPMQLGAIQSAHPRLLALHRNDPTRADLKKLVDVLVLRKFDRGLSMRRL